MHLTYRWQATLVIALGLLMAVLDVTIVSVVLPQIATALHAQYQTSTWIGTGYLLANAAVIPITGYLSDRVGSKTIFLFALGLFTLGSALCAFAQERQTQIPASCHRRPGRPRRTRPRAQCGDELGPGRMGAATPC